MNKNFGKYMSEMSEAFWIANDKPHELVSAKDAFHKQFYGVFQCKYCRKTLSLRSPYSRKNGVEVGAAFVHSSGVSCRQKFNINPILKNNGTPITQKQYMDLLEAYLIWIVKLFLDFDSERHNEVKSMVDYKILKINNIKYNKVNFNFFTTSDIKYFTKAKAKKNNVVAFMNNIYDLEDILGNITFRRWDEIKVNTLLNICSEIFYNNLKNLRKKIESDYFLLNPTDLKGMIHSTNSFKIPINELFKNHYSRIVMILDFFENNKSNLLKTIIGFCWIKNQSLFNNFQIIQMLQDIYDNIKMEKVSRFHYGGTVTSKSLEKLKRFENNTTLIELTLTPIENLVIYNNWDIAFNSLVEFY